MKTKKQWFYFRLAMFFTSCLLNTTNGTVTKGQLLAWWASVLDWYCSVDNPGEHWEIIKTLDGRYEFKR